MPGTNDQVDPIDNEGQTPAAAAKPEGSSPSEALALRRGWVPKEEFQGDPLKWVDADTFVERGNNFNATLQKKVKSLEERLASFQGTAAAFQKFHKEAMEGKDRELASALKQLKTQHREAIRDGDDEEADALEGRMEVITKERAKVEKELAAPPEAPAAPANGQTPELKAWIEEGDNSWFETDLPMQKYALAIAEQLVANGETLKGRAFLDKVAEQVRADFPQKFKNPLRNRPGATEGASGAVKTAPGRSAKDLPDEDRALMKQFIKEGWMTEEKFLKDYRW